MGYLPPTCGRPARSVGNGGLPEPDVVAGMYTAGMYGGMYTYWEARGGIYGVGGRVSHT